MAPRRDYDDDPGRYRLGMQQAAALLAPGTTSVYERIWQLLPGAETADACPPASSMSSRADDGNDRRVGDIVADIGCADGALAAARPSGRRYRLIGLDLSAVMLRAHPRPALRAEATALPLREGSVAAAVLANMLYHLDEPAAALREARRVLVPGGIALLATVSRHDSPELAPVWRPAPSSFDAEDAAGIARQVFASVQEEWWDAPLLTLPDGGAVRDYLIARQVPARQAERAADHFATPLPVTKRGVLLICK